MRAGVLGTGPVGQAIASRLVQLGHEVVIGARDAANPAAAARAEHHAPHCRAGTFADAAAHGAFVFLCTQGAAAEAVARSVAGALGGKLLIDVTNPLDFSGPEPALFAGLDDSLGERVQRAAPGAHVVKGPRRSPPSHRRLPPPAPKPRPSQTSAS